MKTFLTTALYWAFYLGLLIFNLGAKSVELQLPQLLNQQKFESVEDLAPLLNDPQLADDMKVLAAQLLIHPSIEKNANNQFILQLVSGQYSQAKTSLKALLTQYKNSNAWLYTLNFPYQVFVDAKLAQSKTVSFEQAYAQVFDVTMASLGPKQVHKIMPGFNYPQSHGEKRLFEWVSKLQSQLSLQTQASLSPDDALVLIQRYQPYRTFRLMAPFTDRLIKRYQDSHYDIKTDVLIKTKHGATLSALVVRPKTMIKPHPTALQFHIYANLKDNVNAAINAANHGYVGVVADSRGKRLSPDDIVPFEHDAKDVTAVIDWISKQPFSDGRVAMYGSSYLGFTQWAAAKYMHPALKTIVPAVANLPMQGLPMENNIFITANYQWPFFVMNNKTLDYAVNSDRARWNNGIEKWYQSGRAYRDIDKVEGTPNPLLHKFLDHPTQDEYWQSMGPHKQEYANINIPVLSINGYYDDGHVSALHYLREHQKYNKSAQHYWVIGPYDHFFTQSDRINGYKKDPVAALDKDELSFQWFDYVLKGAKMPDLVKDKVNYQLMGDNSWQHASSMAALNRQYKRFFLGTIKSDNYQQLSETPEPTLNALTQTVDLADPTVSTNTEYYPWPIIKDELKDTSGFTFASAPFEQDTSVHGSFSGELKVKINKRDLDIGLTFYELMNDGKLFELSFYIARASFAKDRSHRHLLTPGKIETIAFKDTRMTGKLFKKGSRLVVVVNVNKNANAQVNFGSGKDVSGETTAQDGKEPLKVQWFNNSFVNVPMTIVTDRL